MSYPEVIVTGGELRAETGGRKFWRLRLLWAHITDFGEHWRPAQVEHVKLVVWRGITFIAGTAQGLRFVEVVVGYHRRWMLAYWNPRKAMDSNPEFKHCAVLQRYYDQHFRGVTRLTAEPDKSGLDAAHNPERTTHLSTDERDGLQRPYL